MTKEVHTGRRIKDLQDAEPIAGEQFDTFLFPLDVPLEDSTCNLSGKALKKYVGELQLTDMQRAVLALLSVDENGNLKSSANFYSEGWLSQVGPAEGGGSGGGGGTAYHDQLLNLDYPDQHPIAAVIGLQAALDWKAAADHLHTWASLTEKPATLDGFGITDAVSAAAFGDHELAFQTHLSSNLHLTAAQRAVLSMLSVDADGNLKVDGNAYTSGWLSQVGPAEGSGSGGGNGTMYHDKLLNLDYPDQHPIAAVTGLQTALDSKATATHSHAWGAITGKPDWITDEAPQLDGYLPLTGGNLSGELSVAGNPQYSDGGKTVIGRDVNGAWFNSVNSSGSVVAQLLMWHDGRIGAWTTSSPRFNDIWHSGNSNNSNVDWTANQLFSKHIRLGNPNPWNNMNTDSSILFMAYRDVYPTVVGAKIMGDTYSIYGEGVIQNTDLVFCTMSGWQGQYDQTVERMRIQADGTVVITGNLLVKGKITQLG